LITLCTLVDKLEKLGPLLQRNSERKFTHNLGDLSTNNVPVQDSYKQTNIMAETKNKLTDSKHMSKNLLWFHE